MIPALDTRIASMTSAVTGAILPALGDTHPFALEQAQLLAGHLQVLRLQEPVVAEFEHLDLNRARAFAAELMTASAGGPQTSSAVSALRGLLEGPVPYSLTGVRTAQDAFAAAIGGVIEAVGVDGDESSLVATQEIGVRHERENALRYRAFFASMGYEDGRTPLPDLEQLMTEFRTAYGEGSRG